MDDTRRSGMDRRQNDQGVSGENRKKGDRRMMLNEPDKTIAQFRKVPMFRGLDETQLKEILRTCSRKEYATQEYIYSIGDSSETMFILLKGEISIMFSSGLEVKSVRPAGTVGEMGLFTGEPRSATVISVTDCLALVFSRTELLRLFSKDKDLAIKVLLNVIKDLSKKMRQDNDKLEELLYRIRSIDLV